MAKKKKQSKAAKAEPTPNKGLVVLAAMIAVLGSLAVGGSCAISQWRVAPPITYTFRQQSRPQMISIQKTSYGLWFVSANGDAHTENWWQHYNTAKAKAEYASTLNKRDKDNAFVNPQCNDSCLAAMFKRASVYSSILAANLMLLSGTVIGVLMVLLATGCYWITMKSALMLSVCYGIGGGFSVVALLGWVFWTQALWKQVFLSQQIPWPQLSLAPKIYLGGCCALFASALFSLIALILHKRSNKKEEEKSQLRQLLKEYYPEDEVDSMSDSELSEALHLAEDEPTQTLVKKHRR